METDTWNNCYPSNWSGKIVPDAIAHPAKFSSKLIRKIYEHRAMLVHHKGTQMTLTGEAVEIKTESKSFFRRLAEKKGSPRIDWESVLCMEKPG